jgi:PAS domain-containing protein
MTSDAPQEALVHDPEERAVQVRRLDEFLRWLLPLAMIFGAIEVVAAIPTGTVEVALTGLIILVYAVAVVGARMLLRRGRLERAVRITSVGIMIAALLIAMVQPELWPPLAMIPLVAVGVALPYTRGAGLVRLLVGAGAGAVAIAAIGSIGTFREVETVGGHASSLPPLFLSAYVVAALGAVATLVLVLLFQFSSRLKAALDVAVAANRALLSARSALESERERLDTTLRSIGDGVITTDGGGLIVFMNPSPSSSRAGRRRRRSGSRWAASWTSARTTRTRTGRSSR